MNPACDARSHRWSCPPGSRVYSRAAGDPATCLPFQKSSVALLGGSLVRVPIDGGRCLWVADDVLSSSGAEIHDAGFIVDPDWAYGECPQTPTFPSGTLASVVTITGTEDPALLVQIDPGFVFGGETRVPYRLFRRDPSAVFGAVELGGGVGTWDASAQKIVVAGPSSLAWQPGEDLGDASLVVGGVPYIWGCHGGPPLIIPCDLGRLDADGALELLARGGAWVSSTDTAQALTMFDSGPWISSVISTPDGSSTSFLHVYASSFGSTLETHTSAAVAGPWSSGPTLAACDLSGAGPKAFCAGPVVHTELADPTRPHELVISYQVGTTARRPAPVLGTLADADGSRLVWVSRP